MYITKYRDRYQARQTYLDTLTGSYKVVTTIIDKDTPQQRNKAQKLLDERIRSMQFCPESGLTMAKLIDMYLTYLERTVKQSTYMRNRSVCNQFRQMFGNAIADKLNAGLVRDAFMRYTESPTTFNEYLKRYKAMMRWAYRSDLVESVAYLDKLQPLKEPTKREKVQDKFLEREEVDALLAAMNVPYWNHLTRLLVLSGLRVGEALALDESDIDLRERTIRVDKTLSPTAKTVTSTKTLTSTRDVFMQDELLDLVSEILMSNRKKRTVLYLDHTPLFFGLTGDYLEYDAYRKYLRETSEKAIHRVITPHTLRHTHASLLAEQGLPLSLISSRLGHSSSRITAEIYVHITERRKKQENEMLRHVKLC